MDRDRGGETSRSTKEEKTRANNDGFRIAFWVKRASISIFLHLDVQSVSIQGPRDRSEDGAEDGRELPLPLSLLEISREKRERATKKLNAKDSHRQAPEKKAFLLPAHARSSKNTYLFGRRRLLLGLAREGDVAV